jgi:hypothetical protein
MDEPAQFKARLQFRRAHQPDKQTFKQASIGFFVSKDW